MNVQGKAVTLPSSGAKEHEPEAVVRGGNESAMDEFKESEAHKVVAQVAKPTGDQGIVFLSTLPQGGPHTSSTLHTTGTGHRSIHHFCTKPQQPQLPLHLQVLSQKTHVRHSAHAKGSTQSAPSLVRHPSLPPAPNTPGLQVGDFSKRKGHKDTGTGIKPDTKAGTKGLVQVAQEKSIQLLAQPDQQDDSRLQVSGVKMEVAKDPSSLLWSPAPPKLSLHPATIQSHLFPDYSNSGVRTKRELQEGKVKVTEILHKGEEEEEEMKEGSNVPRPRLLGVQSVPDFSKLKEYMQLKPDVEGLSSTAQPTELPLQAIHEEREPASSSPKTLLEQAGDILLDTDSIPQDTIVSSPHSLQQNIQTDLSLTVDTTPQVKPGSSSCEGDKVNASTVSQVKSFPVLPSWQQRGPIQASISEKDVEYHTVMAELEQQREQLVQLHRVQKQKKKFDEEEEVVPSSSLLDYSQSIDAGSSFLGTSSSHTSRKFQRQAMRGTRQKGGATGRSRTLRRTRSALFRAQQARELLSQAPRPLQRSCSFPLFINELRKVTAEKPVEDYHRQRRQSEPSRKDFLAFMKSRGASVDADPSEWAYALWWDKWFPEVLQECRTAVAEVCSARERLAILGDSAPSADRRAAKKKRRRKTEQIIERKQEPEQSIETTRPPEVTELETIDPLPSSEVSAVKELEREVTQLSEMIAESGMQSNLAAVHLCRRGATLRKLGRLREAKADLDKAIELAPTLSDAYWHRHLLFLLQSNEQSALEDLTCLLKHNKNHYGAYRSRATLLMKKGDLTSAIFSLSQAISLRPDDPECYFLRGELHERRGEVESAVSNFATVTKLDPGNLEAFKRQAMQRFNQGLWSQAVQHFTALIHRAPNDTSARIYRSQAFYNMDSFSEALQDLSAAIHLDPTQSRAYYHRACLLRAQHPQKALKDFSVSLLLDDSPANVQAYVHRGVLYTQLNNFDEALADFESALRLDHSLASAHVCAGLIHLQCREDTVTAIKCFSLALSADPTCMRAYLCRAQAYKQDKNYDSAILDYTRAIHIQPDNPAIYIYKGETHLKLREFELATMHIRMAAKVNKGFDKSRRQGALVESFLGNHEEVRGDVWASFPAFFTKPLTECGKPEREALGM